MAGALSSRPSSPRALAAIREDYSDASFYSLMNLLDFRTTPSACAGRAYARRRNAGRPRAGRRNDVAAGKLRQRLAALIQFTVPGAPTVYYGDEVAMTGDDDPDDRLPTRGPIWAATPTRRCSRTTRAWPGCASRTPR